MEKWLETTLGTVGDFSKGRGISKNEAHSGTIPCVRYGEIYTVHNDFIKKFYAHISAEVATTSRPLKKGDLLFTGSGETKEEIGKCVAFINDCEAYAGGDIIILTPTTKANIDSHFFGYYLNSPKVVEQKASRGQGDAIVHISADSLAEIDITFPPDITEQRTIAATLSDADEYITALEKLIAKKRAIKQGAMQELLTGKRRLPGFSGEWEEKQLKDIAWFQEGPGVRASQFTMSGMKLLNGTNIQDGKLNLNSTVRYISLAEANGAYAHFLVDEGDIVIASSGITIERFQEKVTEVRRHHLPFCMNTSTIRFKVKEGINKHFVIYFLKSDDFKSQIGGKATGSAQLNFGPTHLNEISVFLPTTQIEQTTIATVLSDMDVEIDALTAILNKAQHITCIPGFYNDEK